MDRSRMAVAAVLAGVASVCAWLLVRRTGERDESGGWPSMAPAASAALEESTPALAEPVAERQGRSPHGLPAVQAAGGSVRVLVVDGRSGAPLPGAVVSWLDLTDAVHLERVLRIDAEDPVETAGERAVADEHGVAVLPSANPFVIRARHGALWNELVTPTIGAEPLRLELFPDLVCLVTDARGKPCDDVPLELATHEKGERLTLEVRPTDARGTAAFSHRDIAKKAQPACDLEVAFAFPLVDSAPLGFRADALPEEPQRLELPPTGRVIVELLESDGRPVTNEASVQLALADDEREQDRGRSLPNTSGTVLFPYVGLGLELVCRAELETTEQRYVRTELEARASGPRTAGEETRIVLRVGAGSPVLVGRVLTSERRPPAPDSVRVFLHDDGETWGLFPEEFGWEGGLPVATGRDGRFRIELGEGPVPAGARELLFHVGKEGEDDAQARVDLSRALPAGETDLGDVVAGAPPFLVSGRVVDPEGQPLPGAEVRLLVRHAPRPGELYYDGPDDLPTAVADWNGAFELHGWIGEAGDELALFAFLAGREQPEPTLVERGQRGVVVVLGGLGVVSGALLLDPDVPGECVTVTLYRDGAPRERAREKQVLLPGWHDRKASFRWPEIAPGAMTLAIELGSDPRPVLALPLQVVPGDVSDPDLAAIDLRGLLRTVTITVVDETGAPVEMGYVQALDPRGEAPPARWFDGAATVRGDAARLVLTRPVDLAVSARGRRAQRLENVFEDRTVHLAGGLPVRLVLAAGVALPEPPVVLCALLEALEPHAHVGRLTPRFDIGADRTARGVLDEPGRYGVQWSVERRRENGGTTGTILARSGEVVQVEERAEEQVIEVRLDPAALAEALQRF